MSTLSLVLSTSKSMENKQMFQQYRLTFAPCIGRSNVSQCAEEDSTERSKDKKLLYTGSRRIKIEEGQ